MNTSGEVADLMVKEGIQITESAVKLAGLGAKNLAAMIIALVNEDNKLQGKTKLKQLLKSDKPLCILQIKEKDLKKFNSEAKKYGVLFTAVSDEINKTGLCDIIAKQDDIAKLNYIMEKMGYNQPDIVMSDKDEKEPEGDAVQNNEEKIPDKTEKDTRDVDLKKSHPRAQENQSEKKYTMRGDMTNTDKPSVKKKVNDIKRRQADKKSEKAFSKGKSVRPKNKDRG